MNIREIGGTDPAYWSICREERNYAAILFAALCMPGNAKIFLDLCGVKDPIDDEFGIYFEYAYLRDYWNGLMDESDEKLNELKKRIISESLDIPAVSKILKQTDLSTTNMELGVSGIASKKFIQSPGRWTVKGLDNKFSDNDQFLKLCKFKWAFNIKPDIVIHLSKSRAICIEAKHESGEGQYPSSKEEKAIFSRRGLKSVGQLELQQYLMNELLGIQTDFVFIVSKMEQTQQHKVMHWGDVFAEMNLEGMPLFARNMAKAISKNA